MYAETELIYPYFSHEFQQLEEFCCLNKLNNASLPSNSIAPMFTLSDYNIWGEEEGDLFKAPEPIIEEPVIGLDPMSATISMIEDVMTPGSLTMSDIESSIGNGQLLSEVFYDSRNDLLAKESNETPLWDVLKIEMPNHGSSIYSDDGSFPKSVSSTCLRSMEEFTPSFLDFPVVDFGAVYGMRRAFSEGDIETLDNGNKNNISQVQSPARQPKFMSNCVSEDRREKLSRYWIKRSKRNFDRKIKYACRKALADSQPRVRGRFAKSEGSESCKKR